MLDGKPRTYEETLKYFERCEKEDQERIKYLQAKKEQQAKKLETKHSK